MLSQQQNHLHWPEEKTPPALDQKQTVISASSWSGWSLWLRLGGGAVAVGGPFALAFLLPFMKLPDQAAWNVYLLLLIVVGLVSSALLRSWWALLIVPVAFDVGYDLSLSLATGFAEFFQSLIHPITLFLTGFVELGVLIGTPLSKWIERRLHR